MVSLALVNAASNLAIALAFFAYLHLLVAIFNVCIYWNMNQCEFRD